MSRRPLICLFLMLLPNLASGQKSRVLSVFQMIESEKYEEAKEAIELAVWNDKTSRWHRTYYAKGLLCQKAYEAGYEKNETKLTNLYPDQLVVAYRAFEKALALDARSKTTASITMLYYRLANDFQNMGSKFFLKGNYAKAFQSFEHALFICESPLLSVDIDTSLVYNTAISAFESKNWEKAIEYLTGLNEDAHSPNTALLLYSAHINNGDSIRAEEVLFESEQRYKSHPVVVLQLVDLLVGSGRPGLAISVLDTAISRRPEVAQFPWTRGLILENMGQYDEAVDNLMAAAALAPEKAGICYDLGICYFNMGVEISESSRYLRSNMEYREARKRSSERFGSAIEWLQKAHDLEPGNPAINSRLNQLNNWIGTGNTSEFK